MAPTPYAIWSFRGRINPAFGFSFHFHPKIHLIRRKGHFCIFLSHLRHNAWLASSLPCMYHFTSTKEAPFPFSHSSFEPKILTSTALSSYVALIAAGSRAKSSNVFKPHSQRIGEHTFYTMHCMSADLRDYLARWVINRCTLRYFRASPVCNLQALRDFYATLKPENH